MFHISSLQVKQILFGFMGNSCLVKERQVFHSSRANLFLATHQLNENVEFKLCEFPTNFSLMNKFSAENVELRVNGTHIEYLNNDKEVNSQLCN